MVQRSKKLLSVLLSLALIAGLLPALALDGTGVSELPSTAGTYYLTQDISIGNTWNAPEGTTTLDLNGHGIKLTGDGSVINVSSGAKLNLDDSGTTSHYFTVVDGIARVGSGSESFTGGYITGGTGTSIGTYSLGGGIYVDGGKLVLNGGTILGNYSENDGGGVWVGNTGTFSMTGGKIMYNKSEGGGAVTVGNEGYKNDADQIGTFTMTGGVITKNTSTFGGGYCGGVRANNGTINVQGGSISDNIGGADVRINSDTYDSFHLSGQCEIGKVALDGSKVIEIDAELQNTNPIGILLAPTVFTSGLSGKGNASKFTSLIADKVVKLNDSNEAMLAEKTNEHTHNFSYQLNDAGDAITASCTAGCGITTGLKLSISAPTGTLTYDGDAKAATLSTGYNTTAFPGTITIAYTKDGAAFSGTPTGAGSYTASVTVGTTTASVTYVIDKADPTAPTDLTATCGDTLENVRLPAGWSWVDPTTSIGSVGPNTFKANYTPTGDDAANYNAAQNVDVSVTVGKAQGAAAVAPQVASMLPDQSADPVTITVNVTCTDEQGNEVTGQEYTVALKGQQPDWSNAVELKDGQCSFKGLTAAAEYTVYARAKETETALAGEPKSLDILTGLGGFSVDYEAEDGWCMVDSHVTVTPDPENAEGLTYQWYYYEESSPVGEEPVEYKYTEIIGATDKTYQFNSEDEGKYFALKIFKNGQELECADKIGPVYTADITFDSVGGSPVEKLTNVPFRKLVEPECTRENYYLEGWYKDKDYTEAWSFDTDYVQGDEFTLYAKWSRVPVHQISGIVYDTDGKTKLKDVTVTLMQGDATRGRAITNDGGEFSFNAVEGNYNVVAEMTKGDDYIIKTELVELKQDHTISIKMPVAGKNSVVDNYLAGAYAATVGGLDEIAEATTVDPGKSVTIFLSVYAEENVPATEQDAFDDGKDAIKALTEAAGKTVEYLDLKLEKSVNDGMSPVNIGDSNTKLLTIIIPFNTNSRNNITVFRYHGTTAIAMTKDPAPGAEGFTVGDGFITIYAKAFSTYAIGYTVSNGTDSLGGGGGGIPAAYTVTAPQVDNGTVSLDRTSAASGTKVTFTVTPKAGYQIGGVVVKDANGNTIAVTKNADGTYSYIQPSSNVAISVSFIREGICPQDDTCPMAKYPDLKLKEWYHEGIHWALENGLMNGAYQGGFMPDADTTRAMVVVMLWRMENSPAYVGMSEFSDVRNDLWYGTAIRWASAEGIVVGYDNGNFGPDDAVTREQLAIMLYRYAQYKGVDMTAQPALAAFPDADAVEFWADKEMNWMVAKGIINGMYGKLNPLGNASRAQLATMFKRLCEDIIK